MRVIGKILAVIGALALIFLVILIVVGITVARGKGPVPRTAVLELNLEQTLDEYVPEESLAQAFAAGKPTLRDIVDAIDKGGDDSRVMGLVAHFGDSRLGIAQAQEIRDAVIRFRGKKKFAIAFAESFGGDWGPGTAPYYLATGFDQIYLQPSGDVHLTGVIMETPFVKGTIDKLGMKFRGDHRYEYKNALNTFTETKYTPPHREAMEKVAGSWYGQLVRGIADGRHLTSDQVKALIDKAPLMGSEALDAKLVDGLKYRDEVYDIAKKKAGSNAEMIYPGPYLERAGRPNTKGKTIALIFGVGGVARGKSGADPLNGLKMGSDSVSAAFRAASEDKDVKAILFRVDSPGGSYIASDTIWREVVRARQKGKPVIVSMGNVAGSGGYFVAIPADKIVAQPGTITASIGVLSGKPLTTGLWNKLGISWDHVQNGTNATLYSGLYDFSPAEWQRFEASLDRIYADFTGKVAEGRKLPKDQVLKIAKGRIWTGEDAKGLGLVDELGGYNVALKLCKQAAKIPESEEVNLKLFPAKKTLWERLMSKEPDSSDKEGTAVLVRFLQVIQPIARQLGVAQNPRGRELMVPDFAY